MKIETSEDLRISHVLSRIAAALDVALDQLAAQRDTFSSLFPGEHTFDGVYRPLVFPGYPDGSNVGWTNGLWTGQLWLAYELTNDHAFRQCAEDQLPGYRRRLVQGDDLDTHDLGFLYTPSCVAAYRLTGDEQALASALAAADALMNRYLVNAGVIQAWGDLSNPVERGRIIIDCLMNLPLLYWASETTGNPDFRHAAESHASRSREVLVRPDASTFHTFHFDPETGKEIKGTTHQGFSDASCWARGQAWGIYGFALNHRHAPQLGLLTSAVQLADYFLVHLPANGVVYWDLSFGDGSAEPWDSSASAIAVCGLLELSEQLPPGEKSKHYRASALHILQGLIDSCSGRLPSTKALLLHGVYSKPAGRGVDEANLWGDYFYLEALARVTHNWKPHW
jgi:unsaturated chondroitin disaccharide hydrolase